MRLWVQFETSLFDTTKNFCFLFLAFISLAVSTGCRLVDGQDPGMESLLLNSMAVSATCPSVATVAEAYSCQPNVSAGIDPQVDLSDVTWELTAENSCSWIKINPTTGQVFGVPPRDQIGNCSVALRVVTSKEPSSDFVQPLTVVGPKLSFVDSNCPLTAAVDTNYSCLFEARTSLAGAQITYSMSSDNQCKWASINAVTGLVSGTPPLGGAKSCQLSVTAEIDKIASAVTKFKLTVPTIAVNLTANCPQNIEAGSLFSCSPSASAAINNPIFIWSLSGTNSCTWVNINSSTGVLSGTPPIYATGSCRLDFQAMLSDGSFGQKSFTLSVSMKGYTQLAMADLNSSAYDGAGQAVAIDGNFAVIGSPNDNGGIGTVAAYQFDGSSWRKIAVLTPPNNTQYKSFGYSVALSGTSMLIGAPESTIKQNRDGAIVAYEWNGSSWAMTQALTLSTPTGRGFLMNFGGSIAMDGAQALVSTSHFNVDASYLLTKTGSIWSEGPALNFDAVHSFNGAGRIKVALQGSLAAVSDTQAGSGQYGEIHIYSLANGVWAGNGMIAATSNNGGLGSSIDIAGGKLLVGSPNERSSAGSAYLYEFSLSSWVQTKEFRAADTTTGQRCGSSVAMNAGQVVVGCSSATAAGSAYVYNLQSAAWNLISKLALTPTPKAADHFGVSVGLSGTNILVGVDQFADSSGSPVGTAYIFHAK